MAITTAGKTEMAKLWGGATADAWAYIALGTGASAAGVGDETLGTERYRTLATVDLISVLYPEDTLLFRAITAATATYTISEIGILNKATGGDLLCRTVLAKTKASVKGDKIVTLYYVTIKYGGAGIATGW